MKARIYIIALIALFFGSDALSQGGPTFKNTGGTLRNNGTIRVNFGQVQDLPDSLGGRIEFKTACYAHTQQIPNIKYTQLVLSGKGLRPIRLDQGQKPLQVYDSLIMRDEVVVSLYEEAIHAKAAVENNIEVGGVKEVRMNADSKPQDILGDGKGRFKVLNIDNPQGVNVIGKFQVDSALILTQGELNNKETNIAMADEATIYRYSEGSLGERPEFAANVNITYTGEGKQIPTGNEVPLDKETLKDMRVENTGGILLTEHVQVNRSLYVGARIATEFDDDTRYVLTYTPALNPDFALSPDAEIDGTFRRTFISYGEKMLMNNRFTWALFDSEEDAAPDLRAMNFRVKPNRFFELPYGDEYKIKRTFEIWAENDGVDSVKEVKKLQVGYAWRNLPEENQDLNIPDVKFRRWNERDWQTNETSTPPALSEDGNWYYAQATDIDLLGNFVIGVDDRGLAYIKARVFLEGPYVDSSMRTDLAKLDLLPSTPDNIYPYTLVKEREKVVMKNVDIKEIVDWVVMEFKPAKGASHYVPLILKSNGELLTPEGDTAVYLRRYDIEPGDYTVGILHRNHLPVYSLEPLAITTENNGQEMDFTKTSDVYGKEGSLRPLDVKGGFVLYGMVAGDVNGDNKIDEKDYRLTWQNRDQQFIRTIYDINMQGYVNTRDLNYPWNNRDREANIP